MRRWFASFLGMRLSLRWNYTLHQHQCYESLLKLTHFHHTYRYGVSPTGPNTDDSLNTGSHFSTTYLTRRYYSSYRQRDQPREEEVTRLGRHSSFFSRVQSCSESLNTPARVLRLIGARLEAHFSYSVSLVGSPQYGVLFSFLCVAIN